MERITKGFWIWCEFTESDSAFLSGISNSVQKTLKGPSFDLHLTLAGPFNNINESSISNIVKVCQNHSCIKVNPLKYKYKNDFFESFYIPIENSEKLIGLRNSIYRAIRSNALHDFYPHISLSYGNHEKHMKEDLISKLVAIKKTITIDKVTIVDVNEDIFMWKPLEKIALNANLKYNLFI